MNKNNKTLVIKLGALGDVVQATPMFKVLYDVYGDTLTLLTTKPFVEYAERTGFFKRIIVDERPTFKESLTMLGDLRKDRYDTIVDLQDVDRTAAYKFGLKWSYKKWITTGEQWPLSASNPISRYLERKGQQPIDTWNTHPFHLFSTLCAQQNWHGFDAPDLTPMGQAIDLPPTPYVIIVAGASMAHQGRKRWPQEAYIDICYRLRSAGITPVLVGSKSDRLNKLAEACNGFGGVNLIDKTSLFQLITLGASALACIGNDTGPQLIVAGARCPTVTLFSEANPPNLGGAWAWDQTKHLSVFKANLAELEVDTVWDAFKRLTGC